MSALAATGAKRPSHAGRSSVRYLGAELRIETNTGRSSREPDNSATRIRVLQPRQEGSMAASNPLRVGLIGAGGRWGPRAHIPALKRLPEIDLYAFCTAHSDT